MGYVVVSAMAWVVGCSTTHAFWLYFLDILSGHTLFAITFWGWLNPVSERSQSSLISK
jgi:hypothetical protein